MAGASQVCPLDSRLQTGKAPGQQRQRRALRLIGYAFAALAIYLLAQSTLVLATGYHPQHSALCITWTPINRSGQRSRPPRPAPGSAEWGPATPSWP